MRAKGRASRGAAALLLCACAVLAARGVLALTMSSQNNGLQPAGVNAGGADGMSSASNQLSAASGEVAFSTGASATQTARAGSLEVRSYPGAITTLAAVETSSTAIQLTWSAAGQDGALGAEEQGSLIRLATATSPSAVFLATAAVVVSTSGANPGDAQQVLIRGLLPNTTYFVRLWTQDVDGNLSPLSVGATAPTLAPPTTGWAFAGVYATSVTVNWTPLPASPPDASSKTAEGYRLEASSTNFGALTPGGLTYSSSTPNVSLSTLSIAGLDVATTYYFRIASLGWDGAADYALFAATMTKLADVPPGAPAIAAIDTMTMTVAWTPVNSDLGYLVQASTAADFTGAILSSSSPSGAATQLPLSGLRPNTTYFVRVGSLWSDQTTTYAAVASTPSTLALPVSGLAYQSVLVSSATLDWVPLPASPPQASSRTSEGYALEGSTTNFGALYPGGQVFSSATPNVSLSTLTLQGLLPDTTLYLRVGSLNWQGQRKYVSIPFTATLASPVGPGAPSIAAVGATQAAASWSGAAPPDPPGTLYRLDASSTNFAAGTVVASSLTYNLNAVVSSLVPDTTYTLVVDIVNPRNFTARTVLGSTATLASPASAPSVAAVYQTSAAVSWAAAAGQGYELDASSTNFGAALPGGLTLSSSTSNPALTSLVVSGLTANTTYFFRVGSLNWESVPDYAVAGASSTVAVPLGGVQLAAAYETSATLNWSALPAAPQSASAEGYEFDASTAPDFSGIVFSSVTPNVALATLTVSGLTNDATYYFRAGALDWSGAADFVSGGSTSTLAAIPGGAIFSAVYVTSATASWSAVTGQGYELDASLDPAFTTIVFASTTAPGATSLTVTGLTDDTTHYFRVGSFNWGSALNYAALPTTSTYAQPPGAPAVVGAGVFFTSATVQWATVASQGYELDASTAPDFSGVIKTSVTTNGALGSLIVSGLSPNTLYYFRVGSFDWQGALDYAAAGLRRPSSLR